MQTNFWNRLKSNCAALALNCREAARAQSEALDHSLPASTRAGLWLHLLICKWCRRYGKQIRFLRHSAHEHHEELTAASPQKLSDEARERMKRKLHAEQKT
jgi:hypothetical protein